MNISLRMDGMGSTGAHLLTDRRVFMMYDSCWPVLLQFQVLLIICSVHA